jgi:PhnB protein
MQMCTYLTFDGRCEAAFDFYARTLGGRVTSVTRRRDVPGAEEDFPGWGDKMMHAELVVGDNMLMGSDAPPPHFEGLMGFSVQIDLADPAEGERIFEALAEGGEVGMPFAETFWATRFGTVVDRFGVPWMLNCGRKA